MDVILIIIFGFFSGAVPYAVLVGKFALQKDVREYGDGNPGAFNAIRAGGIMWGGLVIFLEMGKAALPVGIAAYIMRLDGIVLILAAIAPSLGHAFSPFLRFKGGKAIATVGGAWIGLSILPVPLLGAIMLVYWYLAVTVSGWAVIFMMLSVLPYLLLTSASISWLTIWALQFMLLVYKHRDELSTKPRLKMSPLFKPFFGDLLSEKNDGKTE